MTDRHLDAHVRAAMSQEIVLAAARHFQLGHVVRCKDIEEGLNLNVDLKCASGRFLLRVYHRWMTPQRMACLHTIRRRLRRENFCVPEPIGWVHCGELGLDLNRIIELERYIPHERSEYTWAYHERVFPLLGRLHDTLTDIVGDIDYVAPQFHNYALPAKMLQWLEGTEAKVRATSPEDGVDIEAALKICCRTRDLLTVLDEWWNIQGAALPKRLVHGDYNTGTNVLILEDQSTAILDFDFVDIHERVFEIAYSMFFAVGRLEWGKGLPQRDWSRITRSVELYNSTCKQAFTEQEWASLPFEFARVPLYWVATAGFNPEPGKKVLEEAKGVEESYWVMEHLPDLIIP
ncbi:MAG: phosphotransferase [Candidatus Latescibacteria bacterium]|nr:phosphotransferase [Candidatus Latescibacterota bacterium]